jgi:hypothetical protein
LSLATVGLIAAGIGCNHSSQPKPLAAQSFYPAGSSYEGGRTDASGQARIPEDPRSEIDRNPNTSGVTFPKPRKPEPLPPPNVSPATTQPTTASATTRPVGGSGQLPPGQYQLVGSVVAEVNGTPIYANKVLALIHKPLTQKALLLKADEFHTFAHDLIQSQVRELVDDELWFAAAERALSAEDRKHADEFTMMWRMQQISQAGGSVEVARTKAAADGDDFDELTRRQYRKNMIDVFRFKKVAPRIQVTVDDLRRYYDKHKDDEFTEHQAARFRLLMVSVNATGSHDAAVNKMKLKYQRAVTNGEDFAVMCAKENDSATLAGSSGDVGWTNKGSFKYDKVETAIWKLQPGQFTDVIDTGDALCLARLEEVRPGRVRPFNEQPAGDIPSVQETIKAKLQKEQLRELSAEIESKLQRDAIVRTDDNMLSLCLDMAMQQYAALARN